MLTAGSLPAGLTLSGNTISGTPTTVESQAFTVQVTDSVSDTASAGLGITVGTAPQPGSTVGVTSIDHILNGGKSGDKDLRVTVNVADDQNNPVEGASVSTRLNTTTSGASWTGTASTDADGSVSFRLRNAPSGCYDTDVTNLVAALDWDGDTSPFGGVCKSANDSRSGALQVD